MKIKQRIFLLICACIVLVNACRKAEPFADEELDERMSGGDCTVFDAGGGAYSHAIPGLSPRDEQVHGVGDKMFEAAFVTAPAPLYAGLGPVYNSRSCISCHISDGRGKPPLSGELMQSMLFKLAMPGTDEFGAPLGVPGFGGQLQDKAIAGAQPEGSVQTSWTFRTVTFADGSTAELREPHYTFTNTYMPMPAGVRSSPRIANPAFGLGLLESIEESSILALADPNDADGDGISGRPNYVYDYISHQPRKLGRMGWKATSPDVKVQTAKALNQDMGITTSVFPQKSAAGQTQMSGYFHQAPYDLHDTLLQAIAFYARTLAVPARRNVSDPVVKSGQQLFKQAGCITCHADKHMTRTDVSFKALSGQLIRPYSDMLLHDMGDGLADEFPEFEASGSEWRTTPLWGLGLTQKVSGHTLLLHDGRARNITEAILWHGGEAEQSKQRFMSMPKTDRDALLRFLESL